jgi:hypothetical protein
MKSLSEMSIDELKERMLSAKRRMDRYSRMGNNALFDIAYKEMEEVDEEIEKRRQKD